jgi:hypothetical protein
LTQNLLTKVLKTYLKRSAALAVRCRKITTEQRREIMSDQDNIFPFGKFDGRGAADPTVVAVLNGLQQSMITVLQKIDNLENKVKELESCTLANQK